MENGESTTTTTGVGGGYYSLEEINIDNFEFINNCVLPVENYFGVDNFYTNNNVNNNNNNNNNCTVNGNGANSTHYQEMNIHGQSNINVYCTSNNTNNFNFNNINYYFNYDAGEHYTNDEVVNSANQYGTSAVCPNVNENLTVTPNAPLNVNYGGGNELSANLSILSESSESESSQVMQYNNDDENDEKEHKFDIGTGSRTNVTAGASTATMRKKASNDKPPEPYADIIAKAIFSNSQNMMQLKDIYNYMIENYEYFSLRVESKKWRNAVRHNLSSHRYFTKTTVRNSQGHFWSIHPTFVHELADNIINERSSSCSSVRPVKLSKSTRTNKYTRNRSGKKKQNTAAKTTIDASSSSQLNHGQAIKRELSSWSSSSEANTPNSTIYLSSGPSSLAHSVHTTDTELGYNDSAYLSSNDTVDSSSPQQPNRVHNFNDYLSYKFLNSYYYQQNQPPNPFPYQNFH